MSEQQPTHDDRTRRPRPTRALPPAEQGPRRRPPAESEPTRRIPRMPRRTPTPQPESPPQAPPPLPPDPRMSGLYVPWWGFAIVILAVAAITCGMWWFVLASRGSTAGEAGPTPTPIFVVITASPTLGPVSDGEAGAVTPLAPTETPTEPSLPTETPASTEEVAIQVGSQIIVDGTEGTGLAIRQGPGIDFTYFFVANDGDQFSVEDGPRSADGYTWWYVVDPTDENRAGWAVSNYMTVIQP